MNSTNPIARLIISDSAMRGFFQRDGRNIRIKIENNMIFLKSTSYERRDDTIIVKRSRTGHVGDLLPALSWSGQFMTTAYASGFMPEQPYFKLVAMDRKWIGLEHLPITEAPEDGIEYLQLIAYDRAKVSDKSSIDIIVSNRRCLEITKAVEKIQANLPVLNAGDLQQIMPRAIALADEIIGVRQRLFPEPRPWERGSRVVTAEDVALILRDPPKPIPARLRRSAEPLTDEMAEAIIFDMVGD